MAAHYVYAIVRAQDADASRLPELPAVANPNGALGFVTIGASAALVSPVDEPEVMAVRRNLIAHTRVLEGTMAACTLLPMRFGVVVDDEAALTAALAPQEAALLAALDRIEGCYEAGVRIAYLEGVAWSEIAAANPEIARKAAELAKADPARTHFARMELGRTIETLLVARRKAEGEALAARLGAVAAGRVDQAVSDDQTLLSTALLIRRGEDSTFLREIERIEAQNADRLAIKVVAPAPPYNFVSLKLGFAAPTPSLKAAG